MNTQLQVFQNDDFGEIRTVTIDGQPWFVGSDVAASLGYKNTKDALKRHVDEEDKVMGSQNTTPSITDSLGRLQYPTFINESGLYSLILSSKLPNAKKFKHWVTSEVLPAIRQNGHYEVQGYAPKATSIGEVVNLIKITKQTMKEQGCKPDEIAKAVKDICEQFGVNLPNCFIKPKETTMTDVFQMIDFIFACPKGQKPTYDDFILHQAGIKRIG